MKGDQPRFFDVIDDKSFRDLMRTAQRRALTWSELLEHPLPPALSPRETRRALESLGRCLGVHLFEGSNGELLWYRRTYEIEDALAKIGAGAALLATALEGSRRDGIAEDLRHREATGALALANFEAVPRDSCALEPSHTKRVLGAYREIDRTLPSLADEALTARRIVAIAERLISCAGFEASAHARWRIGTPPERAAILERLDVVCTWVNNPPSNDDTLLLRGMLAGAALRELSAFGCINGLVSSLVSRLCYLKDGNAALAAIAPYAPLAQWVAGEDETAPCTYDEYAATRMNTPSDLTICQTINARCLVAALEEAQSLIRHAQAQTQSMESLFESNPLINERQRRTLLLLSHHPDQALSIGDYQRDHGTSYATARRDLLSLEGLDFVKSSVRNKRLVFEANRALFIAVKTAEPENDGHEGEAL